MQGFFEHQYLSFKKGHLRNLVALARIDENIHESELDFIYKAGKRYGLKKKQIEAILQEQVTADPIIPTSHEGKINQLYDLVGMMLADGVVESRELELCDDIASKLGFTHEIVHKIIDYIQQHPYPMENWDRFLKETEQYVI
jgi:uncharacterized tellurite resistance protein B-like protein